MLNTFFRFSRRTFLIIFEVIAVIALLMLLAGGALAWRLSTGPLDAGFAREYIEEALYDASTDTSVQLGRVVVQWPVLSQPLQLSFDNVRLRRAGRSLIAIKSAGLGISAPHLLVGRLEPVNITLNRPVLRLVRNVDNTFTINLRSEDEEDQPEEDSQQTLRELLEALSQPEGQGNTIVSSLDQVIIRDAAVAVEDHMMKISWYLQDMDLEFGRDGEGLAINAGISMPGGRAGTSRLAVDAVYERADHDIHFNLHMQDFDPRIVADKIPELEALSAQDLVFNGDVSGIIDRDMKLRTADLDVTSDNGTLMIDGVYEKPLPFQSISISAAYDGDAGTAALKSADILINEIAINMQASASIAEGAITAPVKITIPQLAQSQIAPLWPDVLRGDGAEKWVVHKLSEGSASNMQAAFTVKAVKGALPPQAEDVTEEAAPETESAQVQAPETAETPIEDATTEVSEDEWSVDVTDIEASFDVANMTIDYRNPLTPVSAANGNGVFKDGNLAIEVTSGKLGAMDISKGTAFLENVIDARNGTAKIDITLAGPVKEVFTYISKEPISMGREELGIDTAGVAGTADMQVGVSFPMTKDLLASQVKVAVEATLKDVVLPDVVKTLDLTGGPLSLEVKDGGVKLAGTGKLEGRDITFDWHQYLESEGKPYASRARASLMADDDIRARLGLNLSDWVDGAFKTDIVYTEIGGGASTIDVKADISTGRVKVAPFRYIKEAGAEGLVTCLVKLKDGFVTEVGSLNVQSTDLKVQNGTLTFSVAGGENNLSKGVLPNVKLLENDFGLDFDIDANGLVKLTARGPFMDAQPFITDDKSKEGQPKTPYDGPAIIASVAVDQLRTAPEQTVSKTTLFLDMARDGVINQFEMDATAGQGPIYLRLKPNEYGRMALRLEADDAGAALRAFNIYKNVRGGKLIVDGQAPDAANKRLIEGKAQLSDFRVVNAPVLARLVNSLSLPGILDLLGSDGINFTKLEADFAWQMRPEGHLYTIKNGRTSGASMGLNFEGTIDKAQNYTDISGTIVPASALNTLVGNIPLVGEILAGGRGGALIAATYTVKGPTDKPDVTVNPLSALAPGILRRIFFESE